MTEKQAELETPKMIPETSWRKLIRRIHNDERGAVSLETILIVAAIALPILIFILKFGWPKIRDYFNTGMDDLENEGNNVTSGNNGT